MQLLPQLNNGPVVITSRLTQWGGGVQEQRIDLFEPKEARDFLVQRVYAGREPSHEEEKALDVLAKKLGYLPLALALAARLHGCTGTEKPQDYLNDWEQRKKSVLEVPPPRSRAFRISGCRYGSRVSSSSARRRSGSSTYCVTSLRNRFRLPCSRAKRQKPKQAICLDSWKNLRGISLIQWDDSGTVAVHRLLQEVVRFRMGEEEQKVSQAAAVTLLRRSLPSADFECARVAALGDFTAPSSRP